MLLALWARPAAAVPLSFMLDETGNVRHVNWYRLQSPRFSIYASEQAEPLARYGLGALEEAYPHLSVLLGVHLENEPPLRPDPKQNIGSWFERVPVVINTQTEGGGFANPVTHNIELKIQSGSHGALFQHELVHRMMYEHFDLNIGPAGRLFSITMTPTWWIEGLAEMLTESIGRLETLGVARTMALRQEYLSWNRLHALYQVDSTDTFLRGYVTSGRLFRYLASDAKLPDLYELHRKLFVQTIIPPFVTAEDFFFLSHIGVSGAAYYRSFQEFEKTYWSKRTKGLVSLSDGGPKKTHLYTSAGAPSINITRQGFVTSQLQSDDRPGAIEWRSGHGKRVRIPSQSRGSSRVRVYEGDDGVGRLWSVTTDQNRRGVLSTKLVMTPFRAPLAQDSVLLDKQSVEFALPKELASDQILDLVVRDSQGVYVLLNREGLRVLAEFDLDAVAWTTLTLWQVPAQVRFVEPVPGRDLPCVRLLVDADRERTSIEEVCSQKVNNQDVRESLENRRRVVVPAERYVILSAADRHQGGLLALAGWSDMVAVVAIDDAQPERPVSAVPLKDWALGLQPGRRPGEYYLWEYLAGAYGFRSLDLESLVSSHSERVSNGQTPEAFRTWPNWQPYVPPFQSMAQRVQQGLRAVAQRDNQEPEPAPAQKPAAEPSSAGPASEAQQVTWEPAPYTYQHWFTYPQARPEYFGGPSIGLVSYPLRDDMERYQVFILGDYNFTTDRADIQAVLSSRRVLDDLRFTLFSRERFNGLYYINPCVFEGEDRLCLGTRKGPGSRGYGYQFLRENGASLAASWLLRPHPIEVTLSSAFAEVEPSGGYKSPIFGVQSGHLVSYGLGLNSVLFDTGFYLGDPRRPGGSVLTWRGFAGFSVTDNLSVGAVKDGRNNRLPDSKALHFQDVSVQAGTSSSWRSTSLTLRTEAGRTFGSETLNRKQIYQPYRTFLLGSGSAINKVNVPIYGSEDLFRYSVGDWMYRLSADVRRPLVRDLGARVTVLFIESVDVEAVFSRGGVAEGAAFEQVTVIDSVSGALRVNMDVKGFKIFPALALGQVLGAAEPALFAEVSFSDFF